MGLGRYCWIQENLELSDVTSNEVFQKRFNTFYRVRRGQSWRSCYYGLMETAKTGGIAFPEALDLSVAIEEHGATKAFVVSGNWRHDSFKASRFNSVVLILVYAMLYESLQSRWVSRKCFVAGSR